MQSCSILVSNCVDASCGSLNGWSRWSVLAALKGENKPICEVGETTGCSVVFFFFFFSFGCLTAVALMRTRVIYSIQTKNTFLIIIMLNLRA